MSQIKNLFFDALTQAVQPAPFLAAPPPAPGLWSKWTEHEGVQLLLHFEYEPASEGSREPMSGMKLEPDYPASVTIVKVYVRDVDILPLLSVNVIDQLEHDLLAERDNDL